MSRLNSDLFQRCSTSTFFFFFWKESTFIPTSLRSLDWKRLFLKNWSPSAESHMFFLADECCLLGRGWCWGYNWWTTDATGGNNFWLVCCHEGVDSRGRWPTQEIMMLNHCNSSVKVCFLSRSVFDCHFSPSRGDQRGRKMRYKLTVMNVFD